MFDKIYMHLIENRRATILILSILVILLLSLSVDLPLTKLAVRKGWRVYQLSKMSGSLESLDRRIEKEKNENTTLGEKIAGYELEKLAGGITSTIDLINDSAHRSGVTLLSVNSSTPVELRDYREFPLDISLEAEYHCLGQFLNLLENGDRAVQLHDLRITTEDVTSSKLNVTLKMSVFFMKG